MNLEQYTLKLLKMNGSLALYMKQYDEYRNTDKKMPLEIVKYFQRDKIIFHDYKISDYDNDLRDMLIVYKYDEFFILYNIDQRDIEDTTFTVIAVSRGNKDPEIWKQYVKDEFPYLYHAFIESP